MDFPVLLKRFCVLFHVLFDGWNKPISSTRKRNLFYCLISVLFQGIHGWWRWQWFLNSQYNVSQSSNAYISIAVSIAASLSRENNYKLCRVQKVRLLCNRSWLASVAECRLEAGLPLWHFLRAFFTTSATGAQTQTLQPEYGEARVKVYRGRRCWVVVVVLGG